MENSNSWIIVTEYPYPKITVLSENLIFFNSNDMFLFSSSKRGFTVLELMVGIIIFTLWFLGAYLLINSANDLSIRSKDEIISANIMREQIELLKNLRDTNWIQFRSWNSIELAKNFYTETDTLFQTWAYYTVENDFVSGKTLWKTILVQKLPSSFSWTKEVILDDIQNSPSHIPLCIDSVGRYTHSCGTGTKKTNYASFIQIEPLITKDVNNANLPIVVGKAFKVTVFFVSLNKGYHLYNMSTIITDWKSQ